MNVLTQSFNNLKKQVSAIVLDSVGMVIFCGLLLNYILQALPLNGNITLDSSYWVSQIVFVVLL